MKKLLLITFTIIISMTASAQSLVWDGAAEPWTHGSGTEDDPYLIETPQNLAYIADVVNGEPDWNNNWKYRFADTCFLLTADIDLGGANGVTWDPIGTRTFHSNEVRFAGHFDGGGHVISNMRVTNEKTYYYDYYGLFGFADGGSIKNVVLDNTCSIQIDDCYNYSGISVGSIIGSGINISVSDCHSEAKINCVGLFTDVGGCDIGGICGYLYVSSINNCYFGGNINCDGTSLYSSVAVGGITGITGDSEVTYCHNAGDIENKTINSSEINWGNLVSGGITGVAWKQTRISHCGNTGRVYVEDMYYSETKKYCGGILGFVSSNSHITTEIDIANCFNVSDVSANPEGISCYETVAGGIVGEIKELAKVNVSNCYHVGSLDADHIGGIMVPEGDTVSVTNSYFIDSCNGDNGFGVPKTDAFMKSEDLVNLLNADSVVFALDLNNINGGYPVFANGGHLNVADNQSVGNIVSCYPNPASDKVNIEIPLDVKVENVSLFNLSGRMIKTQTTGLETIDISGFAPGVYVMKIALKNGNVFEKKIVKK